MRKYSSRRKFIARTSAVVLGAAGATGVATFYATSHGKKTSAADKITLGLIGCKGMGFRDLQTALQLPGVECVALCDVDANVLEERKQEIGKIQRKSPSTFTDFRKLLEQKDIDAVIIGTPDHWHCLPFVQACDAGKDVYVEKPLANSIAECEVMVAAARKYGRIVQVGQQQRSGTHWQKAMEFIKSGGIGQLRKVNIWANFDYGKGAKKVPDTPVPDGVDFDMWLGPAPSRPFNAARFHGSWRMFWDYGGGLMTDWGVHLIDMALWARDINEPPSAVVATGGNWAFPDHDHETFDTMSASFQLDTYTINWEHIAGIQTGPYGRHYGLAFVGHDATLVADREGWEVLPVKENGSDKVPPLPRQDSVNSHPIHIENFIDCIRTRKDPACTVENGRLVALYSHMGNIALRTGTSVVWDDQSKSFGSNTAANALIRPEYRKPWSFPTV